MLSSKPRTPITCLVALVTALTLTFSATQPVKAEASPTNAVFALELDELRSSDGTVDVEAVKTAVEAVCSETAGCTIADVVWGALKILEECGASGGWVVIECKDGKVEIVGEIHCFE